jgi:gliding motility-associated-like protein
MSDTANTLITVHPNPKLYLKDQIRLFYGSSVTLLPDSLFGNNLSYLWTPPNFLSSTSVINPVCTAEDDISYTLKVTGTGGCTASNQISILVLKPPYPPNAFSPNGDGINDSWQIKYLDRYPDATVEVFDRYGQRLYYSLNYTLPWDGTYNGKPLPIGTYYYVINPKSGRSTLSGAVTILK